MQLSISVPPLPITTPGREQWMLILTFPRCLFQFQSWQYRQRKAVLFKIFTNVVIFYDEIADFIIAAHTNESPNP